MHDRNRRPQPTLPSRPLTIHDPVPPGSPRLPSGSMRRPPPPPTEELTEQLRELNIQVPLTPDRSEKPQSSEPQSSEPESQEDSFEDSDTDDDTDESSPQPPILSTYPAPRPLITYPVPPNRRSTFRKSNNIYSVEPNEFRTNHGEFYVSSSKLQLLSWKKTDKVKNCYHRF